jgi:hypothetical protein
MGQALGFIYAGGFVVAFIVLYVRVGFPGMKQNWQEFLIPNLPWFGLMAIKAWAWPITLAHWFYKGQGPSAWEAVTEVDGREVRRIRRPPHGR